MSNPFRRRLTQIKRALANSEELPAALILSSAPKALRSRDQFYPYRQDSDFYYLTGSREPEMSILISPHEARPILFAKPRNRHEELWDGRREESARRAEQIGAELVVTPDQKREIRAKLRGIAVLYHNTVAGSLSTELARELSALPSAYRADVPHTFRHSDLLLEQMRLHKDREEIKAIERSAQITNAALMGALPFIQPGGNEGEVSAALSFYFELNGAVPAFKNIVASGSAAATLHYVDNNRPLKSGDLLLLDCGAEHELYAGDISRTVPVSGVFTPPQRVLYQIVLDAQRAALSTIRHNVPIKVVYDAAAEVLTEGLRKLKVLRGSTAALLKKGAYKPYFPHGIGHSLGIDVHDIGKLRGNQSAVLKKGMVFTVEPGLYFAKRTPTLPPCGVRIEDDVVVTERGCTVLSAGFPKEINEIEELIHQDRHHSHDHSTCNHPGHKH